MKIHGREMVESTVFGDVRFMLEVGLFRLQIRNLRDGSVMGTIKLMGGVDLIARPFDGSDPIEDARQWLESESARIAREMVEMAKFGCVPVRADDRPMVEEILENIAKLLPDTVELGTIQVGGDGDFEAIGTKLGTLPCPSSWTVEAISGDETALLGSWQQIDPLAPGAARPAIKAALHNSIGIGVALEGLPKSKEWRVVARRIS